MSRDLQVLQKHEVFGQQHVGRLEREAGAEDLVAHVGKLGINSVNHPHV